MSTRNSDGTTTSQANKPFFVPQKEIDLFDVVNEELIDELVGQTVDIYKVNIENNLVNPFQIKKELGIHILTELYDENIALSASLKSEIFVP